MMPFDPHAVILHVVESRGYLMTLRRTDSLPRYRVYKGDDSFTS